MEATFMRRGNPCQMLQEVARQKGNLLAENHQSAETADHLENGCSSVSGQREKVEAAILKKTPFPDQSSF